MSRRKRSVIDEHIKALADADLRALRLELRFNIPLYQRMLVTTDLELRRRNRAAKKANTEA